MSSTSEMVVDWGYRSTHLMTVAAKQIAKTYYSRDPQQAYFMGCSTGGRQGLVEAQRYPWDFDGIISGSVNIGFEDEVMAVLSRGGCNQGACHGKGAGQNGFRLSLLGFDPRCYRDRLDQSPASLTVLDRHNELRAHIHAALNVGASRQEVTEVIFQQVTYGGMPVVVEALAVFKEVLVERGEWQE